MRHYLGISHMGEYAVLKGLRKEDTSEPLLLADEGEVIGVRVNFTDWLDTGETISSTTLTNTNCTVTASTSSPNVDLTVSAVTNPTYGKTVMLVTSSTSKVWRGVIQIRRRNRYTEELTHMDYR